MTMPSLTRQVSGWPLTLTQPVRSLPLKSGTKPSSSAAGPGPAGSRARAAARGRSRHLVFMESLRDWEERRARIGIVTRRRAGAREFLWLSDDAEKRHTESGPQPNRRGLAGRIGERVASAPRERSESGM